MRLILLAVLFLALLGCSNRDNSTIDEVAIARNIELARTITADMSEDQFVDIMGSPSKVEEPEWSSRPTKIYIWDGVALTVQNGKIMMLVVDPDPSDVETIKLINEMGEFAP